MGTKRKLKSKKGRKRADEHTRRCKCSECSDKRSKRKWNRHRTSVDRSYAEQDKRRREEYTKKGNTPGFLAGGHPNIKRDFTFEPNNGGVYHDTLSPLHVKARNYILNTFPNNKLKDSLTNHWGRPTWNPMMGMVLHRAYQMDLPTDKFDTIKGEIDLTWHGTKFFNITSIGHNSLETRGNYGLLGAGIYLTPDFLKAWGFSGTSFNWGYRAVKSYRTVLLCATKLGKVLDSKNCVTHAEDCNKGKKWPDWVHCSPKCKWHKPNSSIVKKMGYDTSAANRGFHPGAYGRNLIHNEYCVYSAARVLPLYVLVFSQEGV